METVMKTQYRKSFREMAKSMLPDWMFTQIHRRARGQAGGLAPRGMDDELIAAAMEAYDKGSDTTEVIEKQASGIMICLYLPEDIARNIALEDGEPADDMHLTLAYVPSLGQDDQAFQKICETVKLIASDFMPVIGKIGGVGFFNASESSDGKDVFYGSFNSPEVTALRQAVCNALEYDGVEVSYKHGFTPHVTLKYIDPSEDKSIYITSKLATNDFKIPNISIGSKAFREDIPLTGRRVLKGGPGSGRHSEGGPKKPESKKLESHGFKSEGEHQSVHGDFSHNHTKTTDHENHVEQHHLTVHGPGQYQLQVRSYSKDSNGKTNLLSGKLSHSSLHENLDSALKASAARGGTQRTSLYQKSQPSSSSVHVNVPLGDVEKESPDLLPDIDNLEAGIIHAALISPAPAVAITDQEQGGFGDEVNKDDKSIFDIFDDTFGDLFDIDKDDGAEDEDEGSGKGPDGDDDASTALATASLKRKIKKALKEVKGVPIFKADPTKQLVYGVVLAPDEIDAQEDWMTAEDIEKTAHLYLTKSRVVGSGHTKPISAEVVESYIAPQDFIGDGQYGSQKIKKGSWVLGVKVNDKKEWNKVAQGDYTGFSVGGFGSRKHGV